MYTQPTIMAECHNRCVADKGGPQYGVYLGTSSSNTCGCCDGSSSYDIDYSTSYMTFLFRNCYTMTP